MGVYNAPTCCTSNFPGSVIPRQTGLWRSPAQLARFGAASWQSCSPTTETHSFSKKPNKIPWSTLTFGGELSTEVTGQTKSTVQHPLCERRLWAEATYAHP